MYIDTLDFDHALSFTDFEPVNDSELLAEIGLSSREIRDVLPPLWIAPADNTRPEFQESLCFFEPNDDRAGRSGRSVCFQPS